MSWQQTSSLFPAGGSFKVDGVHSDNFGMYYRSWAYDPIPTIRSGMIDIPGRRGKTENGSEVSSRLFTMDLTIADPDPAMRWKYMHAWATAMNPETGPHAIELVEENPGWLLYVQPQGGTASPELITSQFSQSFEAPDPHWYSIVDPSTTLTFNGSPSYGTVIGYGNTYSDLFMIVYPRPGQTFTNPTITVDQQRFSLFGTMNPGETWNVDSATKTVTRDWISDPTHWSGTFPVVPGNQAGFQAGGLGSLVTWQDAFGQGGVVEFHYRTRLY